VIDFLCKRKFVLAQLMGDAKRGYALEVNFQAKNKRPRRIG
jgi:hypothetical protein